MDIVKMDIDAIIPYENNPRKNDKSVKKVARSLKEFGWQQPIVVDKQNVIIVGHTRYKAAKYLKLKKVPVVVAVDLTDKQAKAYRLADNRLNQDAEWDDLKLGGEFQALDEIDPDYDFTLLGFDSEEIDNYFGIEIDPEEDDDDNAPNDFLKEPVTQEGDIWMLDNHFLMCADATDNDNLVKLFNTTKVKKVDMIFTDPPYNIDHSGSLTKSRTKIENDKMSDDDFIIFLQKIFFNCKSWLNEDGAMYVCFPWKTFGQFKRGIESGGFSIKNCIIWKKGHFVVTTSEYKPQYEMIFYCHDPNVKPKWCGDKKQSNVWDFPKNAKNDLHPTMKPVPLVKKAILNSSMRGGNILDLFGGSGSTLIACEETERNCYMMELDVNYCDNIIRRWQKVTEKEAINIKSNKTFNELLKK
jgi:site-specific DNA-methyltransferase (adenine-specific)